MTIQEKIRLIEDTFGYNSPEANYIRKLHEKKVRKCRPRRNFMRVMYINLKGELHVEMYKWAIEQFNEKSHVVGDEVTLETPTHIVTGIYKDSLKSGLLLTHWKIEEK